MTFPQSTTGEDELNKKQRHGDLDSPELLSDLVCLYFRYIHNVAHSLFHEPSFMDRLKDGSASLIHVYAMCALAAR